MLLLNVLLKVYYFGLRGETKRETKKPQTVAVQGFLLRSVTLVYFNLLASSELYAKIPCYTKILLDSEIQLGTKLGTKKFTALECC
ncbi:hypothetical protein DDU33_00715 [Actinobacillus porcitonsillarum]|uniref:Uncharacterized protein n=1 Tax=Actinobacillus porcitonsillarum TaxID=189834 RepID=A0A2U8FGL2_9PAST|nr:hypothetical protein DDU33_00715 [Actinobacillus porcitonsillarum]